ncbi:MAG: heparinase II/III family protein [Chloroflexi bacterium]|nr:heparinase II/III family protein [Chloroflexota bacterium]
MALIWAGIGVHNGYERLSEPVTHRRQIFFVKPEYWVVIDVLTGQGKHCFDLYFHLMPGINPQLEPSSGYLRTGNGLEPGLAIVPLASGDLQPEVITGATNPIQGWISFFSGKELPASTLRYRQEGMAPIQFCTVLYPYPAGQNASITISAINLEIEPRLPTDQSNFTSLCIETEAHIDYLIVDRGLVGAHKFFAGYESDAQLLFVRYRKEENKLVKVITRGGHRLLCQGHSLFETNGWTKDFVFDCEL